MQKQVHCDYDREWNFILTWKEIGISYRHATLVIYNAILSIKIIYSYKMH